MGLVHASVDSQSFFFKGTDTSKSLHAKYDLRGALILRGDGCPESSELVIGGSSLANDLNDTLDTLHYQKVQNTDLSVPSGVVVDINDAISTSVQACLAVCLTVSSDHLSILYTHLDKIIVFDKVGIIEGTAKDVVGEELPANRKTESIETISVDKVLHLPNTIGAFEISESIGSY